MNTVFDKYGKPCAACGTLDNLTRHHLKNSHGKKTGEIKILCRRCHDDAEEEYRLYGITSGPVKATPNEQIYLDYINGVMPFYSLGKTKEVDS